MTEEDKNLLAVFEARVRHLLFLHDKLKAENNLLKEALAQRDEALRQKEEDRTQVLKD